MWTAIIIKSTLSLLFNGWLRNWTESNKIGAEQKTLVRIPGRNANAKLWPLNHSLSRILNRQTMIAWKLSNYWITFMNYFQWPHACWLRKKVIWGGKYGNWVQGLDIFAPRGNHFQMSCFFELLYWLRGHRFTQRHDKSDKLSRETITFASQSYFRRIKMRNDLCNS